MLYSINDKVIFIVIIFVFFWFAIITDVVADEYSDVVGDGCGMISSS